MSYFDYVESKRLAAEDPPFFALIMAAIRKADSDNLIRLRMAFPAVYAELDARYHAPGGKLQGE
jgi:hypothetical protein